MSRSPSLSFEFFPPADAAAAAQLEAAVADLSHLGPDFVSVTHGADGSARERTYDCVQQLRRTGGCTVVPHLTCIGSTRAEVRALAERYWRDGCRRLVALRGDLPGVGAATGSDSAPAGDYRHASELIADLAAMHPLDLLVAAYPEGHPDTGTVAADVANLKRKVDAGARAAITQFFFDTDAFLRYRDRCRAAGITVPIIPGILPIRRFAQVARFAARCGTSIPERLRRRFEGDGGDGTGSVDAAVGAGAGGSIAVAVEIACEQVRRLRGHGVEDFHFYTLNHAELTRAVCAAADLIPAGGDQRLCRFG